MANFGDLVVRLGLDATNFKAGLGEAKTSLVGWRDETNKSAGETAKWGTAIGLTAAPLIAVGYELAKITAQAAEFGKAIKDNARDLGLSTDQYQRWTHAAIAAGSSAEEITGSIKMLTVRLKDASDPTSEVARYLDAMKVSAVDANGNLRDTNDILLDILPALNDIPPGMERNQAAMVLFGRGFSNIADLTSLSRQELEKLLAVPSPFTDAEIKQMDEYNTKLALINEKWEIMSADIGLELIPLMEDVLTLVEDTRWAATPMIDFIEKAVFGIHTLSTGLKLLWLSGPKGSGGDYGAAAQEEYDKVYSEWINAGYALEHKRTDITTKRSKGTSINVASAPSKETGVLTSEEIRDKKLELRELTNITIPDLTAKLKAARLTGLKADIEDASIALERATNKAADLAKVVGVASSGSSATYNELFKSSLDTGGVGPDTAGFSELANMSQSELEAIAAGGLGKSKAMAEKAQAYLARIKAGGSATDTTSTAKKDLSPGSADQTEAVQTESDNQLKAVQTLAEKVTGEYQKMTAAFKDHIDAVAAYRTEQYPVIETLDLIHWATFSETARVGQQSVMDGIIQLVNEAGKNIIRQYVVIEGADGPDWTPPAFTEIATPQVSSADYTTVGAAVQKIVAKGLGDGTSGSKAAAEAVQKVEITIKDQTSGGIKADNAKIKTTSRGLAGVTGLGGQM